MEIKIDRYTKIVLTLIALGLFASLLKDGPQVVQTPLNPRDAYANVGIGTADAKGQRFVTVSPDGKTVYMWYREQDSQWYDRDKLHFLGSEEADVR